MSKKVITTADLDDLTQSFGGEKFAVSEQESGRRIRKKSSQVDGDDSTDDERVSESVAKYKIEESWEDFKEGLSSHDYKKSISENDLKYSFILHAFGRGVYYSEPVNAIYEAEGGLKPTYLRQDGTRTRKTLSHTKFPINHQEFESEIDYIANRRMTDRSEKRREKNDFGLPRDRFGMAKTKWAFGESEVKETKGVKKISNTSRDDWTLYQGEEIPYTKKKSTNWVENVATNLSGIPQDDAEQVRAILRGDRIEADAQKLEKLSFLTNLFFGSETVRSPVGFVSHQMFLDLIGSNQVGFRTWKEAFDGGNFPQMGDGAINALRLLNNDYNGSMPYNYRYDANRGFEDERVFKSSPLSPQQQSQQTARSIIAAEAKVAKAWLALKFPNEPQTPETLMRVLPEKIREWYRRVDLSNFVPEIVQQTQKVGQEELSPQKPRKLDSEFQAQVIDFNQEHETFDHNDLMSCYNDAQERSAKTLGEKHQSKLERNLTDDERFIVLWMECDGNAGLSFNINREEGFAEIKKDDELLAIFPIQSISTDHGSYKETIENFITTHKDKGAKIIFSIHGEDHYKTLAVSPLTKKYRYIDSMHDSEDGVIEHDGLKAVLDEMEYNKVGCSYQKQQYSESLSKESGGVISHNNECAFHNVYTTIRIAQKTLKADLSKMNKLGMTMMGMDQETLTLEFTRDYIRPFYEEVFEKLRNFISEQKEALPNPSTNSVLSQNLSSATIVKGSETKTSVSKGGRST